MRDKLFGYMKECLLVLTITPLCFAAMNLSYDGGEAAGSSRGADAADRRLLGRLRKYPNRD